MHRTIAGGLFPAAVLVVAAACGTGSTSTATPGGTAAGSSGTGVSNLTTQQATDVWTGKATSWSAVGGPDKAIVLVLRPEGSVTRATFKKIVLGGAAEATGQSVTEDSNGAVTQA